MTPSAWIAVSVLAFIVGVCVGAVIGGYREWVRHTGGSWQE